MRKMLKNMIKMVFKIRKGTMFIRQRVLHIAVITVIGSVVVGGAVWAISSDKRTERKETQVAIQKEIAYNKDKNIAVIDEAEIARRAIQNAEKAKELIELKGEFATLTVTTERKPELSSDHTSKWGKIWGGNVLRVSIPYTIKYMVALDKITSFVGEDGVLYIVIDEKDFNVLVSAQDYVKLTPEEDETGWFPKEFSDRETLALLNSNLNSVAEEYSNNEEKIAEAVRSAKDIMQTIADTMNTTIKFVESKAITTVNFTTELNANDNVTTEGDK